MKNLTKVLSHMAPLFDQIAQLSGVPGFSVGVFHQSDVVFRYNYGYRDLQSEQPTSSSTIYPLGSLTKAFTALVFGSLVSNDTLDWHSPIRAIVPEFHSGVDEVERLTSAVDLLAHRTGIPGGETMYFHAQPLLNDSDIIPTFASIPPVQQFRGQMQYNNLGYAIIAMAMSRKTGQTYGDLLETNLLRPLNLSRTGLSFDPRRTEDMAKAYVVTEDKEAVENNRPLFYPGSSMAAAGGVMSSVDDLLVLYRNIAREADRLSRFSIPMTEQSPLRELRTIISGWSPLGGKRTGILERSYGLGWIRTQLPGELGAIGLNPWFVKKMPVAGENSPSRLAVYHQGNLPGATSAVYLFPETQSGVVVLTNAYGLSDVPDWISQAIIDAIFDHNVTTDYINLAMEAVSEFQQYKLKTKHDLDLLRQPNLNPGPLEDFVGDYRNAADTFLITISQRGGTLKLAFQGLKEEEFDLEYLYEGCFSWFPSSRELARKGRHIFPATHYLIHFRRADAGLGSKVIGLEWAHDSAATNGEFFARDSSVRISRTTMMLTSFAAILISFLVLRYGPSVTS